MTARAPAMRRPPARRVAVLATLVVLALGGAPRAAIADLPDAMLAASDQRVLTQRIVKAWCLLGLGNENRQPRAQLFNAIERFEALLAELEAQLVDRPRLHAGLADLRRRWIVFERIAGSEPVRARALELVGAEEQVLEAGNRLVRALAAESGEPSAHLLDLAGRQAMRAQRLVKAYVLLAWGFDQPRVLDQFVGAWNDFEATQAELAAWPGNTPALHDALATTAEEWAWLKSSLSLYRADLFFPGIIDDSGEKILDDIDRLTSLYHRLVSRAP